RVVFEFAGGTAPGYRVGWVDGPVTADGSGKEVEVSGEAHLELRFTPASGVDMATGSPVYRGPDRVPVEGRAVVLTDLVRTGDFEAVLTWVAGAQGEAPFRVTTLDGPVRVVVDLHAG
ncbi:MAG TPA: hypothetical protein VHK88_03290, partial [Aquihabitans sp.]|nr:hypothetical protein [Aquihabitans sp.]